MTRDEGFRANASLEKMATLKPAFKPDGKVTAANSSQISDGAAALLIMDRATADKLKLRPLARFVAFSLAGEDPIMMLSAPIPATRKVLDRAEPQRERHRPVRSERSVRQRATGVAARDSKPIPRS